MKGIDQPLGRRLWHFPGGLKLRHWKKLSISDQITDQLAAAGIPNTLTLPLDQRIGRLPGSEPAPLPRLRVQPGDRVARFERLTAETTAAGAHLLQL